MIFPQIIRVSSRRQFPGRAAKLSRLKMKPISRRHIAAFASAVFVGLGCSCTGGASGRGVHDASAAPALTAAEFSADSAYAYLARQVGFGPRVPGTAPHAACAAWLEAELRRHGADSVIVQRFPGVVNIMGRYNPDARQRILLAAHWDTRPWADAEDDSSLHSKPIDGANDGASGVGVLLEIARQLGSVRPESGVDILFVDAEDSGDSGDDTSWCVGTQRWAGDTPYGPESPAPAFAIVLDMVGGRGARFHREALSVSQAPSVVDRVWATAAAIGHGDIFVNEPGGALVDDHLFIYRAGIPAIDIVESRNEQTGSFPPTWHTLADNLSNIDRVPLRAAGETVMTLIRNFQKQ